VRQPGRRIRGEYARIGWNLPAEIIVRTKLRSGVNVNESILLKFLQSALIDVAGDDVKFEKITAASGDFAEVLETAPSKAVSASLLAFDQNAPSDDPLISEVLQLLKKRWPKYMNTFREDRPPYCMQD